MRVIFSWLKVDRFTNTVGKDDNYDYSMFSITYLVIEHPEIQIYHAFELTVH